MQRPTRFALVATVIAIVATATFAVVVTVSGIATWTDMGTFALAIATVALIIDARQGRRDAAAEVERQAFRAAILEQVENVRVWQPADPNIRPIVLIRAISVTPRTDRMRDLLGTAAIDAELLAYLVWAMGRVRDLHVWMTFKRDTLMTQTPDPDELNRRLGHEMRDLWWTMTDQLQVITGVLVAQCEARPSLAAVAGAFASTARLLEPAGGVPQARANMYEGFRHTDSAPPWPAGPTYGRWSPAARDQRAGVLLERTRAELAAVTSRGLRR